MATPIQAMRRYLGASITMNESGYALPIDVARHRNRVSERRSGKRTKRRSYVEGISHVADVVLHREFNTDNRIARELEKQIHITDMCTDTQRTPWFHASVTGEL
jgi:hypothetical protein